MQQAQTAIVLRLDPLMARSDGNFRNFQEDSVD
jgi:hypothetical protein